MSYPDEAAACKALKSQLRAEYVRRRQALAPDMAAAHAERIVAALRARITRQQVVAGYLPMRGEVDITPLCTALPCIICKNAPLHFRAWVPGARLRQGLHGAREPEADASLVVPDVVLVPLLAFDAQGHRLGYGGGYYDRTLAQLRQENPAVRAFGVAYACQHAPRLPAEPHDALLDAIVTEEGVVTPPPAR